MASINKESIRNEIEALKEKFEKLRAENKISEEAVALMSSVFLIINLLLSILLERQTKKDNKNSSIPSSQTEEDTTALIEKPKKTNSKGKSERKHQAFNARTTETTTTSNVDECEYCGKNLKKVTIEGYERRTKIDIIFEKVVEHVDAEIKSCPQCHTKNKASFPKTFNAPLQYGEGLKAYIINLLVCQMVPLNRVQKMVNTMIGQNISEATLLKFVLRLHQALEPWEKETINKLLQSKAINVDETSLKVDKKKQWIHVYASGEFTLKCLHLKRGKVAVEDIGIIERYSGVIIHDRWASYLSYEHCGHGLCGSHLLRDLAFIIEANNYRWAINMKALLQEACHLVGKSEQKKLNDKDYARLQRRYRNILTRGQKQLPEIPPKPSGKRGKIAKSDAHNLWEAFKKHEGAILLFAKNSSVSFTNNRAERDLRMAKVKQKVSGCFRTQQYAQAYCRISSYLQTMANKGYNSLVAIQMALVERG